MGLGMPQQQPQVSWYLEGVDLGMPPHPGMVGMPQQQPQVNGRTGYGLGRSPHPGMMGILPHTNKSQATAAMGTLPIQVPCTVTLTQS